MCQSSRSEKSVNARDVRKVSVSGMCQKKCQCPGCEKSFSVRFVTNLNFCFGTFLQGSGNAWREWTSPFFKHGGILMTILFAPYMTWQSALCLIQRKHSFTLYFTNLYIYIYSNLLQWRRTQPILCSFLQSFILLSKQSLMHVNCTCTGTYYYQ
jgi:hypothetical protein